MINHKSFITSFVLFLSCILHVGAQTNEFGYATVPDASSAYSQHVINPPSDFNVSPTGAAVYSVPIEVPKGLPGMEPNISITYNSQAGNGVVGYGCNITGISVISRVAKDVYHDNLAKGLTWGGDDGYALDGVRLVLQSGKNGANGAVYCLENDPSTTITLHGEYVGSFYRTWFEAHNKEGLLCSFGGTDDSRQDFTVSDGKKTNAWYVNRVENQIGNYMTYSYFHDSLFVYPSRIDYGMNVADASVVSSVIFSYVERYYDHEPFCINGAKGAMCKKLTGISSETNRSLYRAYSFNYTSEGTNSIRQYNRLAGISVSANGYENLKPISLAWNTIPNDNVSIETLNLSLPKPMKTLEFLSDPQFMTGDFNGDGISDIVEQISVNEEGNIFHHFYFYLSLSNGAITQYDYPVLFRLPGDFEIDNWSQKSDSPMVLDYDGDGLSDLVIPKFRQVESSHFYCIVLTGKNICQGDISQYPLLSYQLQQSTTAPLYTSSDINGDGLSDITVLEKDGNNSQYRCCTFMGRSGSQSGNIQTFFFSLPSAPRRLFSSDYNGDGLPDLMAVYDGGYKIIWNKSGVSHTIFSDLSCHEGNNVMNCEQVVEGDFNGDGLIDFLLCPNGSYTWEEYLNQGDGTFTYHTNYVLPVFMMPRSNADIQNFRAVAADFNGDGKTDVIVSKAMYDYSGNFTKTHTCWLMSGRYGYQLKYHSTSVRESDAHPGYYTAGNFHGFGHAEFLNYGYNCLNGNNANVSPQVHIYSEAGYTASTGRLSSVTDSYGRTIAVSYKPMADPSVYSRGTSSYPVVSPVLPISIVSSTTDNRGAAGQHTINYTYAGMKMHTAGRGFIGMTKMVASDVQQGTVRETGFTSYGNSYYVPTSTYAKTTMGGKTSTTTTTMTLADKGKAYAVSAISDVATDYDGLKTTTTTTYDADYGYKLSEQTESEQHSKSATYQYTNVAGVYRPSSITYIQKHPDDVYRYTYTDTYSYNNQGLVTVKTAFSNKSRPQVITCAYDAYGNVIAKTLSGSGGLQLPTEHMEYDATHRFVTRRYSSDQLPSYGYSYNTWGQPVKETTYYGSQGLQTQHQYNSFGQLVSTTYPDGTKTTYTYGWGTTTSLHHYVLTQGTAKPWVKTWYDNCGREVLTETVGPKDYAVSVSTTYNQKGLPSSRVTNEGTRHQTETLGYDGQGRLTSDVFSTGRTCSYSYGKLSATSTEDGVTFQKTFDPWGNLKKSVQGGKSITYTYGSHGKPVSVRSSADSRQVMSVQYDDMVCRTSFTDVDAGTLSYSYDGLNRLVSQTDARGMTISYTYNTIGQKTKETAGTDVTTYVYNTTGYGLGKLSSANRGAYTIEYDYDELGRVTAERRCFSTSQSPYSYTYQYNTQGLLDTKTYPGGVVERFQYDAYGNMTTQTVNNQTVWQHVTATGKEDTYALGGGALSRLCGYNDAGRLTATTTQGSNASNPLFQMSFDYLTPDGNLAKRHLGNTITEQFSYDTSNRLTSVSGGGENTVVTYSLNGNITNKTGLGQYYYDTDKLHAVSAVDNTDGLIPLNTAVASYNGYGKLSSINNKGQIKYNTYKYGPDGNRWLLTRTAAINVRYVGDMEYLSMPQKKTWFYYLANDILYVKKDGAQDSVYYMCRDNLGSIMKLVGANGHVAFDATYDAWGRQTVNCNQLNFFRGYTGHEMLKDFNLINMNGRMYDPLLGRFLSPDNYVQFPYDVQNFNRYSYCLNNPLKYTDPSGQIAWLPIVIGALAGAYLGGYFTNDNEFNPLKWNYSSFNTYAGMIIGGGVGAYAGYGVGAGFISWQVGVFTPFLAVSVNIWNSNNKTHTSWETTNSAGNKWNSYDSSVQERAGESYDNTADEMREYYYASQRGNDAVNAAFGGLEKYGTDEIQKFARYANNMFLRRMSFTFSGINVATTPSLKSKLRQSVIEIGNYAGAEIGGVIGGGTTFSVTRNSQAGYIGFSYGALIGGEVGSGLAGFCFDLFERAFLMYHTIRHVDFSTDPAILMQYNESPYNIYQIPPF